ncbi:50S ribosomal protein L18 [Methylomonas methanica]|uniref:Large ribosomal subunit protein uL18 n=1 Tax=Methylomonas methanica (strain DSM 25384 / MC09) TaxID=857087 RepID=F9ZWZ3_METMM|nr:50S ribosomal protein L18 [Methylomonas methanica]AEG02155.1 ribosomal protein L18 [Methylomonas methanica MC09]
MDKKSARLKRALKLRCKIKKQEVNRLTIHRTSQHIYAQVLSADGKATLAAASTVEVNIKSAVKNTSNVNAATEVGKQIAEKAIAAGVTHVAFDRSGFKYHGRVKALADAAREAGLKF